MARTRRFVDEGAGLSVEQTARAERALESLAGYPGEVGHRAAMMRDVVLTGEVPGPLLPPAPVCPRCLGLEPGKPGGTPDRPHSGPFTDDLCGACKAATAPPDTGVRPVPCGDCHEGQTIPGEPCAVCGGHGEFFSPALRAGLAAILARRCGGSAFAYGHIRGYKDADDVPDMAPVVEEELRRAIASVAENVEGVKDVKGIRCFSFPGEAAPYVEALLVAGRPTVPRHLAQLVLPAEVAAWVCALGGGYPARLCSVEDAATAGDFTGALLVSAAVLTRADEAAANLRRSVLLRGGSFVPLPAEVAARWPLGVMAVVLPGSAR